MSSTHSLNGWKWLPLAFGLMVVAVVFILLLRPQPGGRLTPPRSEEQALAMALTATAKAYLPAVLNQPPPTATPVPPTATPVPPTATTAAPTLPPTTIPTIASTTDSAVRETFEGAETGWTVTRETAGAGSVVRSTAFAAEGVASALASTSANGARALVYLAFNDAGGSHAWQERPGTYYWQRSAIYVPAAVVNQLGANEYFTLAGLYPSAGGSAGWWLRVKQGGELYAYGYDADGNAREFRLYGKLPLDRWVEFTLGLHSQNGPGVKRAFAFLLDGNFYGWYHQGRLTNETYNRAAVGILGGNTAKPLQVYVDRWRNPTAGALPDGPDNRPTNALQEQDYRTLSGVQWQIDWSTWGNDLRMHPTYGLYSASNRLQSGRNLDRMPDLTSGWAEIEMDWPNGTPPSALSGAFGPMVGFRKEINREENLEVIPMWRGGGVVDLVLEAWVNGGPVELAHWAMPTASIGGSSIPEPGDIIRVRWEQINATQLQVKASFFDFSANRWYTDIINSTFNLTNIGATNNTPGVNFNDGYHKASSITIDSNTYSIRRFKLGTLDTYINPPK